MSAKRHDLWLMVLFNRWRLFADKSRSLRKRAEFKALLHWAMALQRKAFSSLRKYAQQAQRDNVRRVNCSENVPWSDRRAPRLESRGRCYVSPFSGARSARDNLLLDSSLNISQQRRIGARRRAASGFGLKQSSHRRSTVHVFRSEGKKSCQSLGGVPSHLARGSDRFRFGGGDGMDEVARPWYNSADGAESPSWPRQHGFCLLTTFVDSDGGRMRPVQSIASVKEYHARMHTVASVIDDMVCSIENA